MIETAHNPLSTLLQFKLKLSQHFIAIQIMPTSLQILFVLLSKLSKTGASTADINTGKRKGGPH